MGLFLHCAPQALSPAVEHRLRCVRHSHHHKRLPTCRRMDLAAGIKKPCLPCCKIDSGWLRISLTNRDEHSKPGDFLPCRSACKLNQELKPFESFYSCEQQIRFQARSCRDLLHISASTSPASTVDIFILGMNCL